MPKAFDRQRLTVTHDPNQRIDFAPPRLKKSAFEDNPSAVTLRDLIAVFTGVDVADPGDWPIWGTLVELWTGQEDGDKNDLGSLLNNLLRRDRAVPKVTGGVVGDENPNLLLAPDFRGAGTVDPKNRQNWSWSDEFGFDSVGCARVDAAGYLSELLSNEIPVTGGQSVYDLSVMVKWSGSGVSTIATLPTTLPTTIGGGVGDSLIYTGTNPIVLGVTRYKDREVVGSEDLAFIASPAGSSSWVELFYDQYTPADDCDEFRLRFKVGANLVSGTVLWDDASVKTVGMGLMDRIVQGLENLDEPGWNYVDLLLALLGANKGLADHAARITYLETLLSSGSKINDEFLRVGTTLGANWDVTITGAGGWKTDGDMLYWDRSGFSTSEAIGRYQGTPAVTTTNTQRIIAVLGSKGQQSIGVRSAVDLYGHMNTAKTEWMRSRFWSDGQVDITRKLAGVETVLGSINANDFLFNTTGNKPPPGNATIEFLCGIAGVGDRFFRAIINGSAVSGSAASPVSDATCAFHLGYGIRVRSEGSLLALGQAIPSKVNAWAAIDNT